MRRVAVVGPGGAGKSTFAEALGCRLAIPVVHLDEHHWKPGWVETAKDEWRRVQAELVAGECWIVDGNYGGTFDLRFDRADTVIVFAPGRFTCLVGALRRTLQNRGVAVQAAGCPERVDIGFFRWIWRYPVDSRPRLDAAIARHSDHLRVVELCSRRQAVEFLDQVPTAPPKAG